MCNSKIKGIAMGLIFTLLTSLGLAQEKPAPVDDFTELEQIKPMSPAAGDFLTEDLTPYVRQAQEYYREGKYKEAARYFLYVLKRNAGDFSSIYNLACCYALMDRGDLAGKYLELAVKAGFTDISYINGDPDFNQVRGQTRFKEAAERINEYYKERHEAKGDMVYFDGCAIFPCYIRLPVGYDPTRSYPLVVGLHGYGSSADYFVAQYRKFENPQFIFAVPFAPYHFQSGGLLSYSWNLWLPGDEEFPGKEFYITENYINNLITQLKRSYKVSDVYLMGHSQGAATSYITGIKHHELFKGIVTMAGPFSPLWFSDSLLQAANHLRVLIVHGKNDKVIRFVEGKSAKNILEKNGFKVDFIEFDGTHNYPPEDVMHQVEKWLTGK